MPIKLPPGLGALGCLPGFVSRGKQGRTAAPRPPALPGPSELNVRRAPAGLPPATGHSTHLRPRVSLPVGTQGKLGELFEREDRLNASGGTNAAPQQARAKPGGADAPSDVRGDLNQAQSSASKSALPGKNTPLKDPQSGKLDADGTLIGHQSRTQPLQRHEFQQVGYQLGAKLNGDAIVDPDQRRQLADGTQTAHEVRVALKHGRGNVGADSLPSGGHNGIGASVSYRLGGQGRENVEQVDFRSGVALAVGAGNCDQHGDIASRLHIKRLSPRETVNTVSISTSGASISGHVWAEVRTKPKEDDHSGKLGKEPQPIVIDPWANGPAARLQDTAWAPAQAIRETHASFDAINGKQHLQTMQETAQRLSPGGERHGELLSEVEYKRRAPTEWGRYQEPQVIATAFAAGAREKLAAMSTFGQEIMAAGTAREAYGLSVKEATKLTTTTQIIDQALSLDKQSRPPVVKPSY